MVQYDIRTGNVWLLRFLRKGGTPLDPGCLTALPRGTWERLMQQAERHRVLPLLYRQVQGSGLSSEVPSSILERLEKAYERTASRGSRRFAQLGEVLASFQEQGVSAIALKGAHLAEHVCGDVALRAMLDVDLLVRMEDLSRAERALAGLGYRPLSEAEAKIDYEEHRHLPPFVREGSVTIEIHRTIDSDVISPQFESELWDHARRAAVGGVDTLVLSAEHLLLHLCLHIATQHKFQVRLKHVYDIPEVIATYGPTLDWARFARTAAGLRIGGACYYVLAVAEALFGTGAPAEVLAELQESGADPELVEVIQDYVLLYSSCPVPEGIERVVQARGRWEGAKALSRELFPPPARLREIYSLAPSSPAAYLYYLIRPWDLLVRRGGFLLQLASRGSESQFAVETARKGLLIAQRLETASPVWKKS